MEFSWDWRIGEIGVAGRFFLIINFVRGGLIFGDFCLIFDRIFRVRLKDFGSEIIIKKYKS